MKILAAVWTAPGADFQLEEVDLDQPRADEICVAIQAVGICHTDVHAQHGGFSGFVPPAVLGHEGAGIVVAVGDAVTKVKAGARVALSFRYCGQCRNCISGHPAYCLTMPQMNYNCCRTDGSRSISHLGEPVASNFFGQSSFATHALTYEANVVALPDDVPFEIAAPMGCGFQTGAGTVFNALQCEEGSSLLVLGGGGVGLAAAMAAKVARCSEIIVVEPVEARRALAVELGATKGVDPFGPEGWSDYVRNVVPGGMDYIIDTTGIPSMLEIAPGLLGPRGTLACLGIPPTGTGVPGDLKTMLTYGQTIKGVIEGDSQPDSFIPYLIDLWRSGAMPFEKLITVYPFRDINRANSDQASALCIKPVLQIGI